MNSGVSSQIEKYAKVGLLNEQNETRNQARYFMLIMLMGTLNKSANQSHFENKIENKIKIKVKVKLKKTKTRLSCFDVKPIYLFLYHSCLRFT